MIGIMGSDQKIIMKLFLLTVANKGYDTYDSCVVCAETEYQARRIHPKSIDGDVYWSQLHGDDNHFKGRFGWISDVNDINVTYLGEAAPNMTAGVVCASFNPG